MSDNKFLSNDDELFLQGSTDYSSIDEQTQENDLTVLRSQMSADELVSDNDVIKTEILIEQGRQEDEDEQEDEDYSSDYSEGYTTTMTAPTTVDVWAILKKSAINLVLPFINGVMLGFGEIFAHEIGFRYGWLGARVVPVRRTQTRKQTQSQFL